MGGYPKLLTLGLATALAFAASSCGSSSSHATSSASTAVTDTAPRGSAAAIARTPTLPNLIASVRSGIVRIDVSGCGFKGSGTGVLVGPNEVVTVEHVVDAARTITIERGGRRLGNATVIGADGARDVALLRTRRAITGHRFAIAEKQPRLGDSVAVLGYPLGLPLTVTRGTVSGLGRVVPIKRVKRRGLIQTDAAVNPGNSGGPLLLLPRGEVVGLVDLGSLQVNGIAFAVSGRVAGTLIDAWRAAPQPLPSARCSRHGAPPVSQNQVSTKDEDVFQSPSGNIRCAYIDQVGVACMTLNNGLSVVLRSFDTSYYLNNPYQLNLPAGRPLPYGSTWSNSSFRCSSRTGGIECWSTVTGHGFFINRDTRRIY